MYTPKLTWLISTFLVILILGLGLRDWTILVTLLPLTVYIILSYAAKISEDQKVEVVRQLEQTRFQENEYVEITLKIQNNNKKTINMLEIYDKIPPYVSLKKGSNHIITSLAAGEETTLRYTISCDYRGRWNLGPTQTRIRNFLHTSYTVHTHQETVCEFVIIPNFETIRDMPFRTKYPKISEGPFHSKLKGEGLDFSGVREYLSTDSLSRINWLSTAKYGKLFTNEYELFRSADLLLVLDATEKTASILDDEIKAVLSLTEHFLNFKCRVGLVIIRDAIDRFDLSSSRQQLAKFTEKLIDVRATKVNSHKMLRKRVETSLDYYYPLNCLTIFISPLIDYYTNKILIRAAKKRRNSFFLSPSIISAEWRYIQDKDNAAILMTHQDLIVKRRTELLKIIQQGALIFEWDVTIPFSVFMNKLKQVAVRRGHF
jgi:uncharacterized protein (DUF58 family)